MAGGGPRTRRAQVVFAVALVLVASPGGFGGPGGATAQPAVAEPVAAYAESCHTATEGEVCFHNLQWAKSNGIKTHPHMFPNLDTSSPLEAFQQAYHDANQGDCPKPCPPQDLCHTTVPGEKCHSHVLWAMRQGVNANPQMFPGLKQSSSVEEFQAAYYRANKGGCPQPCSGSTAGQFALGPPARHDMKSVLRVTAAVLATSIVLTFAMLAIWRFCYQKQPEILPMEGEPHLLRFPAETAAEFQLSRTGFSTLN